MPQVIFVNRFYAPDYSATARLLTELTVDLAASGYAVSVIASRMRYDDSRAALAPRDNHDGVLVHRVPTTRFGRGGLIGRAVDYASFYVSAAWAVWRLARRGDVVVAKTDPPLLGVALSPWVRLRGARQVQWLQDVFPEVASALGMRLVRGLPGRILQWCRNRSLRSSAAVVCIGDRMRDLVRAKAGPLSDVRVLPNWIDAESMAPVAPADNRLRRKWQLEDSVVVGYSGNMGRAHDFATLFEAGEKLSDHPEIRFLITGGGAGYEALRESVRQRGRGHWRFEPYQPDAGLEEALSVADIHLVTLRPALEGTIVPSKFYSAAAVARPVLFYGAVDGEIPRLIRAADCGKAVPEGRPDMLADAILTLAQDATERERLGNNGRRYVIAEASRHQSVERWSALLADLGVVPTGGPQGPEGRHQ